MKLGACICICKAYFSLKPQWEWRSTSWLCSPGEAGAGYPACFVASPYSSSQILSRNKPHISKCGFVKIPSSDKRPPSQLWWRGSSNVIGVCKAWDYPIWHMWAGKHTHTHTWVIVQMMEQLLVSPKRRLFILLNVFDTFQSWHLSIKKLQPQRSKKENANSIKFQVSDGSSLLWHLSWLVRRKEVIIELVFLPRERMAHRKKPSFPGVELKDTVLSMALKNQGL